MTDVADGRGGPQPGHLDGVAPALAATTTGDDHRFAGQRPALLRLSHAPSSPLAPRSGLWDGPRVARGSPGRHAPVAYEHGNARRAADPKRVPSHSGGALRRRLAGLAPGAQDVPIAPVPTVVAAAERRPGPARREELGWQQRGGL